MLMVWCHSVEIVGCVWSFKHAGSSQSAFLKELKLTQTRDEVKCSFSSEKVLKSLFNGIFWEYFSRTHHSRYQQDTCYLLKILTCHTSSSTAPHLAFYHKGKSKKKTSFCSYSSPVMNLPFCVFATWNCVKTNLFFLCFEVLKKMSMNVKLWS